LGKFAKFAADQDVVTPESRFVDFGGFRPATIPAGTAGSTKDITIQDNVTALVESNGKHEQVLVGTLVRVGESWKLFDLPSFDTAGQSATNSFLLTSSAGSGAGATASQEAPSDEMQQLMTDLETLDSQAEKLPPDKQAAITEKRADLLLRLADTTSNGEMRLQWYRQLADMLSVAVQSGGYPQGLDRLDQLQAKLAKTDADPDAIAHVVFQRMWAAYVLDQQAPEADAAKVQETWLADLEQFIQKYPKSTDAADAMLQLGMYQEFVGKSAPAQEWYEELVTTFPDSAAARKANGAVRRLKSVGKPIRLRGPAVQGGTVDLAQYRGKIVLIQYWATWCEPCIEDMQRLKELYQKYGGKSFEIIGVSLDESPGNVQQFLTSNRFPWKQIYEPGGLDGRLAEEMGVMTLPLMILVDEKGNVVDHSIFVAELEPELKRLSP
jgi:thiol-disulfide isomerase/thioredoxin